MRRTWKIKAPVTDIANTRRRHWEKKFDKQWTRLHRSHVAIARTFYASGLVLAANFCRPISRVSVALCRWRTLNEREADGQPVTKVTGHTSAGIFTRHTFRVSFSRAAEPPIKVANRAATSLATAVRFSDSRKQITRRWVEGCFSTSGRLQTGGSRGGFLWNYEDESIRHLVINLQVD